jgi:hypothetical protein
VSGPGRKPIKAYICPECRVSFTAPNNGNGKSCPNGHWHSIWKLNFFLENGRIGRAPKDPAPSAFEPTYTTADELAFVDGLGRAGLIGYLDAAERRTDWGQLDRAAILARCRRLLLTREKKRA